jgi:hypothetical protein
MYESQDCGQLYDIQTVNILRILFSICHVLVTEMFTLCF